MGKMALQAAVDTATRSLATGITMRRNSWLQSLGFCGEIQNIIQDLPFESNLFSEKTGDSLRLLKDSVYPLLAGHLHPSPKQEAEL